MTEYAISFLGKIQKKNVSDRNRTLKEKHTRQTKNYSNLGKNRKSVKHVKRPKDNSDFRKNNNNEKRSKEDLGKHINADNRPKDYNKKPNLIVWWNKAREMQMHERSGKLKKRSKKKLKRNRGEKLSSNNKRRLQPIKEDALKRSKGRT